MEECLNCHDLFEPTRKDQQFCVGKGCRQAWHEKTNSGEIVQIRGRKDGDWTFTVRVSGRVRLKKGDKIAILPRSYAS